jgi:hypothetical protein
MRTKTRKVDGVLEVVVNPNRDARVAEALAVMDQAFVAGLGLGVWVPSRTLALYPRAQADAVVERHQAALMRYEPEIVAILERMYATPQWRRDRKLEHCRLV